MTTRAQRGKRAAIWGAFALAVIAGIVLAILNGAGVPTLLDSGAP